jgi:hypothetical protein
LKPETGHGTDFQAARLAVEAEGDAVAERRRRHRRPVTPELAESPGTADVHWLDYI